MAFSTSIESTIAFRSSSFIVILLVCVASATRQVYHSERGLYRHLLLEDRRHDCLERSFSHKPDIVFRILR